MAANKTKTPQQSAALRAQIYQRYCCGQSQERIAVALGLRQSAVSYHLKRAREALSAEAESHKKDRLAELDHLRSQCWKMWEKDRTAQATAFLAQIQKAIVQERALLGLDAPRSVVANVTVSELPSDTEDTVVGSLQAPIATLQAP